MPTTWIPAIGSLRNALQFLEQCMACLHTSSDEVARVCHGLFCVYMLHVCIMKATTESTRRGPPHHTQRQHHEDRLQPTPIGDDWSHAVPVLV